LPPHRIQRAYELSEISLEEYPAPASLRSRDQAALRARANFLRMHVQKGGSLVEIESSHDGGLREMTAYLRTVAAARVAGSPAL
jgi:hypothetical protein